MKTTRGEPIVTMKTFPRSFDVEKAVAARYSSGAKCCEGSLCCAIEYDPKYLAIVPAEIIERDYGCGDPVRHVRPGETVLDLGSGGGKVCYIAAQIVGASGRVIGVDMNDEMLELARRHQSEIEQRLGYANVEFRKGRIQDLAMDVGELERLLMEFPIGSVSDYFAMEKRANELRQERPLIASGSIDVVLSNCVLNLVEPESKSGMFEEIHRVLKPGGRAVISDIVSNVDVPSEMREDPELWTGCISGAYREDLFLEEFVKAGLERPRILDRMEKPWQVVKGIEFRSVTVEAMKR